MKKLIIFIVLAVLVVAAIFILRRSEKELTTAENSPSSTPTATPTPVVSPTPTPDQQIQLFLPTVNDKTVGSKFVIFGKGIAFESVVNYEVMDKNGGRLIYGAMMTNAPDSGQFGYFTKEINLAELKTIPSKIVLEVFESSAKDGSKIHINRRELDVDTNRTAVYAFFNNQNLDPEVSCNKTFAVSRLIPKTQTTLKASIEELLKGPTVIEDGLGFKTSINQGVTINSLKLSGETATIDFSKKIEENAGGSCRVASIRSQISNTARQFLSVKNVVISVDGRVEDALQP